MKLLVDVIGRGLYPHPVLFISSQECLPHSPTDHLPQAEKARQEVANAENKLDQYRKDANQKIDATDRKIEEGAAKAKSGISSWFGGSK